MVVEEFLSNVKRGPGEVVSAVDFAALVCLAMALEDANDALELRLTEGHVKHRKAYEDAAQTLKAADLVYSRMREHIEEAVALRTKTIHDNAKAMAYKMFGIWKFQYDKEQREKQSAK